MGIYVCTLTKQQECSKSSHHRSIPRLDERIFDAAIPFRCVGGFGRERGRGHDERGEGKRRRERYGGREQIKMYADVDRGIRIAMSQSCDKWQTAKSHNAMPGRNNQENT